MKVITPISLDYCFFPTCAVNIQIIEMQMLDVLSYKITELCKTLTSHFYTFYGWFSILSEIILGLTECCGVRACSIFHFLCLDICYLLYFLSFISRHFFCKFLCKVLPPTLKQCLSEVLGSLWVSGEISLCCGPIHSFCTVIYSLTFLSYWEILLIMRIAVGSPEAEPLALPPATRSIGGLPIFLCLSYLSSQAVISF